MGRQAIRTVRWRLFLEIQAVRIRLFFFGKRRNACLSSPPWLLFKGTRCPFSAPTRPLSGTPLPQNPMSQTNPPNPRARRGGRHSHNRHRSQNRSQGSRSQDRPERSEHTSREDHRDWEPVDRGRDIRRRAAAKAPTLMQKILSILTFGMLGKKSPAKKTATVPPDRSGSAPRSRNDRENRGSSEERVPRESRPPRERTVSAPDPDAVTGPRLHVGNLSYEAAESDLMDLFKGAGQVQSAEVVYHRDTQRSKGFAFVRMLTADEARRAVSELHGKEFMGRRLEIGPARSTGERTSRERDSG